jgi:hypothetical protein
MQGHRGNKPWQPSTKSHATSGIVTATTDAALLSRLAQGASILFTGGGSACRGLNVKGNGTAEDHRQLLERLCVL